MFSKLWVRLLLQQLLDAMCFHRRLDSRPHCVAACDEANVFAVRMVFHILLLHSLVHMLLRREGRGSVLLLHRLGIPFKEDEGPDFVAQFVVGNVFHKG